ncbi:hypothetical protein [Maribacter arcticus]|uniref:hypothetical protein n=1 Tax=Maribacter arcticus TaxID=561365 RepID=UPI0030D77DD4|tara:strand:+ start:149912 stop:151393 length:1482 start_codon:yes stop_codon:yes gene_type:complete
MITILTTTNFKEAISEVVETIDRLNELVGVVDHINDVDHTSKLITVEDNIIKVGLDWYDTEPPYVLPNITYSANNLLAVIFYKLGNQQKAFEFLSEDNSLHNDLLVATHLQFGYDISEDMFSKVEALHNQSIIQHYGNYVNSCNAEQLKNFYIEATETASNDELKVFIAKHYSNFLLDGNAYHEVEQLMRSLKDKAISPEAQNALDTQLALALMAQLQLPYKNDKLKEISELFHKGINFYEAKKQKVNAGLLYVDASEIANFQNDHITSKELINKAILIFKEADIPEFLGEAGLRKATLLYTWSKNGSPQYYKPAINAFQDTLKVFKRDTHPQKFADVHHNLALIYSEIPVSLEEKPIWTAFCASSFKEVLKFYTKEKYPYEYAMASHNYATALMSFPEAKVHNNLDKAFGMFENALTVRTAKTYPFERALTLINQLELYWIMHNEDSEEESKKYNVMLNKANEVSQLVTDNILIEKAKEHIEALKNLKTVLN